MDKELKYKATSETCEKLIQLSYTSVKRIWSVQCLVKRTQILCVLFDISKDNSNVMVALLELCSRE